MGRVIVIEFVSVDGIMEDPDGREKSAQRGWAFRYGPQAVAGDKFALAEVLDSGTMLLGRRTWQMFAQIWPGRDDDFSAKMNAIPKLVASRSLDKADEWQNSTVLRRRAPGRGAGAQAVRRHRGGGQRQHRPRAGGGGPGGRVPAAGLPAGARLG